MSAAVEWCPSSFRPLGLVKRLCSIPSRAAFSFIQAAKVSLSPAQ